MAATAVKYISADVRQLEPPPRLSLYLCASILQELSAIIKSNKLPRKDYLVVDVRDSDFIGGHITNCHHTPSTTFLDKLDDLVKDTKDVPQVIFHCALSQQRWVSIHTLSLAEFPFMNLTLQALFSCPKAARVRGQSQFRTSDSL